MGRLRTTTLNKTQWYECFLFKNSIVPMKSCKKIDMLILFRIQKLSVYSTRIDSNSFGCLTKPILWNTPIDAKFPSITNACGETPSRPILLETALAISLPNPRVLYSGRTYKLPKLPWPPNMAHAISSALSFFRLNTPKPKFNFNVSRSSDAGKCSLWAHNEWIKSIWSKVKRSIKQSSGTLKTNSDFNW